jgi:hypothetical protein
MYETDGRLNKKPIFIVAFAYGGSNILLNLLRSHPDLCSPRGELNEVFKGKLTESIYTRIAKCIRYLPCMVAEGRDVFRFNSWRPRKPFKPFTRRLVDRILHDEKLRARAVSQNRFKAENVLYTREEIEQSRLLCKNLDGLTYVTEELAAMYPDATFFALVRNGLAVSEGHLRRGYDFEAFAKHYEQGCQKMIHDAKWIKNYHIIRYEDLIDRPLETLKKIYALAGLDLNDLEKVRLQTKKVITKDGSHAYVHNTDKRVTLWYGLDEFGHHFKKDANENQIKRLTKEQKALILRECEKSLKHFDYWPQKKSYI